MDAGGMLSACVTAAGGHPVNSSRSLPNDKPQKVTCGACRAGLAEAEQELRPELEARRRQIGIVRHPILTLRYFGRRACRWLKSAAHIVVAHPVFVYLFVPGVLIRLLLGVIPGAHTESMAEVERLLKFGVWWVGLGILSSVGMGCAIHSGMLFLYPHIVKTCLAAQECGSLDFDVTGNAWFSEDDNIFACPGERGEGMGSWDDGETSPVTYLGTLLKVYPACVLWGVGSAIGEIPPYAVSRAAAEAGEQLSIELKELDERDDSPRKFDLVNPPRQAEVNTPFDKYGQSYDFPWTSLAYVTRAKRSMITFLQLRGFWGVFVLSAVLNMAFDLCGICCGHFGMPFWHFFGGTLLGKAGVRVFLQASFLTMVSNQDHLETFISLVGRVTPVRWGLGEALHAALTQSKRDFHNRGGVAAEARADIAGGGGGSTISGEGLGATGVHDLLSRVKSGWAVMMTVLVVLFVATFVEQVARTSAVEEDQEAIQALLEKQAREEQQQEQCCLTGTDATGAMRGKVDGNREGETFVTLSTAEECSSYAFLTTARECRKTGEEKEVDNAERSDQGDYGLILDISSPSISKKSIGSGSAVSGIDAGGTDSGANGYQKAAGLRRDTKTQQLDSELQ